jgi:hypothetical protein
LSRAIRAEPSSFQGFSHAERPKDTAPLQSGSATYFPPKSVDAECRPLQTKRFWKRATKLRAISRTGPGRDPVRQHCRGGKLLSTRRTLLQIDVRGPRRSIVGSVTDFVPPDSPVEHPTSSLSTHLLSDGYGTSAKSWTSRTVALRLIVWFTGRNIRAAAPFRTMFRTRAAHVVLLRPITIEHGLG